MSINSLLKYPPSDFTHLNSQSFRVVEDLQFDPISTTNRDVIITPATGMIIFNETADEFQGYWDGTWNPLGTMGPTGPSSISIVTKVGSGAGNYTLLGVTGSPYTVVDAANLSYTVVIPVGSKLTATATFDTPASPGSAFFAFFNDSTIISVSQDSGFTNGDTMVLQGVVTGDGASHTISLQMAVQQTFTSTILNSAAAITTTPLTTLRPSIIYRLEIAS